MSFKFAINAGHWKDTTRGIPTSMYKENGKFLDEWTLNDRIVDAVITKLKKYQGIEILRIDDPTGVTFYEDKTRWTKANNFKADFYLGIHHNGGICGGTGGGIVSYSYLYKKFDGDNSADWSKDLYNALVKHTGLKGNRSTPIAKDNLFEVRETSMPAVLLELGFMDSKTDIEYITNHPKWANDCADAIVEVIVKRAKLKEREEVFKKGETSLGIESIKSSLNVGKLLGIFSKAIAKDGGYGAGVATNVKEAQKKAGLAQKDEIDDATVKAIWTQVENAVNSKLTELKTTKASLTAKEKEVVAKQKEIDILNKKVKEIQDKLDKAIEVAGDTNGDGVLNMKDILAIRKKLSKI